jgi:hypothetical protein
MRARRALLALLSCLAFAAVTVTVASADGTDADALPAITDNCPFESNVSQVDSDADGTGDACDEDIAIVDGHVSGGGRSFHPPFTGRDVFFSFAIRSDGGRLSGTGRIVDDSGDTVRILTVDHFSVDEQGDDAVIKGTALVNGVEQRFYLEVHESDERYGDTFSFQSADYSFGNRVEQGSLQIG